MEPIAAWSERETEAKAAKLFGTQQEIADAVGMPQQTIDNQIKSFSENGKLSNLAKTQKSAADHASVLSVTDRDCGTDRHTARPRDRGESRKSSRDMKDAANTAEKGTSDTVYKVNNRKAGNQRLYIEQRLKDGTA